MEFDERLFSNINLNSLLTLVVVYREQGVTKAASRLQVHQPAVSNTLAKLRIHFDDPLFIRDCKRLKPTPKATEIINQLEPALLDIQKMLMAVDR